MYILDSAVCRCEHTLANAPGEAQSLVQAARDFVEAELAGEEMKCRQIVFDLYFEGRRVSEIFDELVAPWRRGRYSHPVLPFFCSFDSNDRSKIDVN